jgi:DNA gyrase/topoisomerase IV subunit A
MIPPEKIDQWLQEAEERPWSAALLVRHIANRLNELTQRNEELQAENIALRTDKKSEDYERQIAALEYQLSLLKRQLGGEALLNLPMLDAAAETLNLLLYTPQGQVLRLELGTDHLESGQVLAQIATQVPAVRMAVALSTEEMLFAFDTGRSVTLPLAEIPLVGGQSSQAAEVAMGKDAHPPLLLDWEKAYVQLPIGSEELVCLMPIARLPLYENIIQISRKACVKKIRETLFKGYVAKSYIGTGIRAHPDRMFTLIPSQPDDSLVLVSKEGFLVRLSAADLPITIEDGLRLGITDHLVAAFTVSEKPSLLVVTNNGKAIHREESWLQNGPLKTKGSAAFSEARRRSGIEVVGAAAVSEDDWGAALLVDGRVVVLRVATIFERGAILSGEDGGQVTAFVTW